MSTGRGSAQVAAALRRTGSLTKEKSTNAPNGNSHEKSPTSRPPPKGRGTPEPGKQPKLPKTKSLNKGREQQKTERETLKMTYCPVMTTPQWVGHHEGNGLRWSQIKYKNCPKTMSPKRSPQSEDQEEKTAGVEHLKMKSRQVVRYRPHQTHVQRRVEIKSKIKIKRIKSCLMKGLLMKME
jgi:hypothetical protein